MGHGSLAGGWICVYVPEGTALNKPFPDYATGKDNYTFYEPNQFVLGHGTWLEGWQIYQTNDILKVRMLVLLVSAKFLILRLVTICVHRVPLSKKLNPGDAIYMIYYVVHTLTCRMLVSLVALVLLKYASKAN